MSIAQGRSQRLATLKTLSRATFTSTPCHEIPKCRPLIRSLVLVVQPIQEIMTLAMPILDLQCWSTIGLF